MMIEYIMCGVCHVYEATSFFILGQKIYPNIGETGKECLIDIATALCHQHASSYENRGFKSITLDEYKTLQILNS